MSRAKIPVIVKTKKKKTMPLGLLVVEFQKGRDLAKGRCLSSSLPSGRVAEEIDNGGDRSGLDTTGRGLVPLL